MTGIGASFQAFSKKPVAKPYMFQATVRPMSTDAGSGPPPCFASFSLLTNYLLRVTSPNVFYVRR